MAELAATQVGDRLPVGREELRTFTVDAATGVAAADEWIETGLKTILAVVGWYDDGTAGTLDAPAFVLNAQGTGVAAGTNQGALGIETATAHPALRVTVRGFH